MNPVEELAALLDSGCPIVVVGSWEEDFVETYVAEAASRGGQKLFIYSAASGFRGEEKTKKIATPLEALQRLKQAGGKTIALLLDFHPFFQDHMIVRALREVARLAPEQGPQIILSMPLARAPMELQKDTAYLTIPLPDAQELRGIFSRAIAERGIAPAGAAEKLMERASVAAAGLTRHQAERVYRLAINAAMPAGQAAAQPDAFADSILRKILFEKRELARGALALEFRETRETFEHIGGLELLKQWLRSRSEAFGERAREYGLPPPRGLLLLGIQGCGKSLTAKAVSDLWKLPLLRLDLSRVDPVAGEEMLIQALHTSEAVAPAVLWIDEIEKGFGRPGEAAGGVSLRSLSAFITWLQEKTAPVYVVATANSIRFMPPELLRKGRFDEVFFINLPSRDERREIFRIHLEKRSRSPQKFDIELLADRCEGFSGAEIEAAIVAGMFEAFGAGRELTSEDIRNAIQTTVPLSTTMEEEIKAIRDWAKGRARPASLDTRLADLLHPEPS